MKSHAIRLLQSICAFAALLVSDNRSFAQGNMILNGNFDNDASAWTLSGAVWEPAKGNPGGFVALGNGSTNTLNATASQTVSSLSPGIAYLLTGDYAKAFNPKGDTGISFGVAIDGAYLFSSADPNDFNWHRFSFTFAPTSPSAVLSLSAEINGTQVAWQIDNISMVAIPEPSAAALLCCAGVLTFCRRPARPPR